MQTSDRELQKAIGILFPLIGAGLLLGAIALAVVTDRFINVAARTEGKVVKLNAGGAHPVIRFTPEKEKIVEFSGSGFINYAVGDKETVLYLKDAQSPSGFQANIDALGALWFTPLLLTGIGVGFVIGGFCTKYENKP